jgi:hypothetical protein
MTLAARSFAVASATDLSFQSRCGARQFYHDQGFRKAEEETPVGQRTKRADKRRCEKFRSKADGVMQTRDGATAECLRTNEEVVVSCKVNYSE